ncbi:plasmolipin isoform X1 [Haliaeetus albicilla]|uniref:plasmolipin isoform X1 n=1 Tax=Haliaeetus albicilla TaxID=8969 RepID=UPI0037E74F8B
MGRQEPPEVEGGETLAQAALRDGRCPSPGNIPGQVAQGSEQPDRVEDAPVAGGLEQVTFNSPFELKPFYDSTRRCVKSRPCRGTAPATETRWGAQKGPGVLVDTKVLGLLVWALIADTTYHLHAAYGWVMFVSIFFWIVTVLFFVTYLLQLQLRFYMIPWPLVLMIFNAVATVLYITAFVTCAAAVQPTSWRQWDYNRRAAASFFAGLTMIAYGASTFFSFRAWKGFGSNAATSQVTDHT